MTEFRAAGRLELPAAVGRALAGRFDAGRLDMDGVAEIIAGQYAADGTLVDPHTAVGLGVARRLRRDPDVPMVVAATAHPAKFPDAVRAATGVEPPLPARLADLLDREERCAHLPADLAAVEEHVLAVTGR
jgi:threonine synthase